MQVNFARFTGVVLCVTALVPSAVPSAAQASDFVEVQRLEGTEVSFPSSELLLSVSERSPLEPALAKRSVPEYVVTEKWARPPAVSEPASPQFSYSAQSSKSESIQAVSDLVSGLDLKNLSLETSVVDKATHSLCTNDCVDVEERLSRTLPSVEDIQQIQQDLRNLNVPEPVRYRRRIYPGITISNPTGYGADRGQVFAGFGAQSRSRFSGGANPGTIFGGGSRDGTAGIGFGVGDARESVGVQVSYTAASFGGSRAPLSGGLNAKIHKQFGQGWAAAIGGEGIINFGRLPEDDDEIEFNDFEGTYYGVVTRTISLRDDFTQPFSRLSLTAGAGSGRFQSVDEIAQGEFGIGVFGSAALQVLPSTTLITEWTGQDLAAGISFAPFPNFPIVFTPAIRDIAGEGDGDPRFVLGVGVSLKDMFSALGL
ncbi:MAG: hypothetical protein AAFV90_23500 [Cyanobacteria bacterium J06634_5]